MDTSSKFLSFFLWEGVLYILLGFLILVRPFPSSMVIELMIAVVILIAGIIEVIRSFELYQMNITAWPFLIDGVIAITIGTLLLLYPLSGLKAITIFIVIYFTMKARVYSGHCFKYRSSFLVVNRK